MTRRVKNIKKLHTTSRMTCIFNFAVALAVLAIAFAAPTTTKKGYSFDLQINAKLPPPISYPVSDPLDGNPYQVLVGVSGNAGFQDGLASDASTTVTAPQFVWSDTTRVVYFVDSKNHLIRAVDATNTVVTVGGVGGVGFNGDGLVATSAAFSRPRGISGAGDRLVVCDLGNARVRAIDLVSTKVSTIAGSGVHGYSGDGSLAVNAELFSPYAVWADSSSIEGGGAGDVYFTELHKCTIRKISGVDGTINTIVGQAGQCSYNGDSHLGPATLISKPKSIFGTSGDGTSPAVIYFTEYGSNLARKLAADNKIVTIAGGADPKALVNEGDGGFE